MPSPNGVNMITETSQLYGVRIGKRGQKIQDFFDCCRLGHVTRLQEILPVMTIDDINSRDGPMCSSRTGLELAFDARKDDIITTLVSYCAQHNLPLNFTCTDSMGTVLHFAIDSNYINGVRALLAAANNTMRMALLSSNDCVILDTSHDIAREVLTHLFTHSLTHSLIR